MSTDIFQNMAVQGLGAGAIVLGAWQLGRSMLQRQIKRQAAEGGLDDRALKLGAVYDGLLDDERAEKKLLRDELFTSYQRAFDALKGNTALIAEAVAAAKQENKDAIARMHVRIDECDAKHAECERRQDWAMTEIRSLRNQLKLDSPSLVLRQDAAINPADSRPL